MIINKHSLADSTKNILAAATACAGKHRLQFTGTEHVLMAMCTDVNFVSFISDKLTFDPEQIYGEIEQQITPGSDPAQGNALRYTPRLTESLNIAASISFMQFKDNQIEPHHLLLAILFEGNSVTAYILKRHGITYDLLLMRCKNGRKNNGVVEQNIVGTDPLMACNAT